MTPALRGWVRTADLSYWGALLGKFIGVQLIVQIIGFASGLLLVRTLSKQDYALFTIANTIMGTMNLLADSGISSGLTAIGGRVWKDPLRFGQLISTAFSLRRLFASVVLFLGLPTAVWLLLRNGATIQSTVAIAFAIVIGLYFQMSNGILTVVPRLLLQTGRLQKIDLAAATSRLLLLALAWLLILNVSIALWIATAAFSIQWWLLHRWTRSSFTQQAAVDVEMQHEIWAIVRKQAPNGIYYCLQGQIAVFLISVLGSASKVADLGALGRFAVIFTIIGSIMGAIVTPRFSRCHDPHVLHRRYFQIVGTFIFLTIAFPLATFCFPDRLLWILGPKYAHLNQELFLIIFAAGVSALTTAMWSLNYSRGWFLPPAINICCAIATQAASLCFLDLSTIQGVILFGLLPCFPEMAFHFLCTKNGIKRLHTETYK